MSPQQKAALGVGSIFPICWANCPYTPYPCCTSLKTTKDQSSLPSANSVLLQQFRKAKINNRKNNCPIILLNLPVMKFFFNPVRFIKLQKMKIPVK
jgi:hypothetical protein